MTRSILTALIAITLLGGCKKENLDTPDKDKNPSGGIPKQGLELLTTSEDDNYFIWTNGNDTTVYRSSEGTAFKNLKGMKDFLTIEKRAQFCSYVDCGSGPYKEVSLVFTHSIPGFSVDSTTFGNYIKPGKYNEGGGTGDVFIIVQGWSETAVAASHEPSTNTPIEVLSVTKVGYKEDRIVYRVRGRINEQCVFGCPALWVTMKKGAFQLDFY